MFKLAICAGHYRGTPGKRLPKALDEKETREWVLNDRVVRYIMEEAKNYGIALLRTDEATGNRFIDIPERTAEANRWGADLYLDVHHNAAGRIFSGGGVEAYCYPGSAQGRLYRDAIYSKVIEAGKLRGNRTDPLLEKRFDSLSMTAMPAVLMEYGYMDSSVDVPVILSEDYAKKVGIATAKAIAEVAGLKQTYTREDFIREVQSVCGAAVDGIAGPETLSKTVTLSAQKNSRHPAVLPVQKFLAAMGYSQVGKADGIAGVKFTSAVVAWQEDHRCWTDGEITAGEKTWRTLLGLA